MRPSVLIVDDHEPNLFALEAVLESLDCQVVKARSGEEALKCLLGGEFALILMDVQMPGLDGFHTTALIKQRERTKDIPIIFITALHNTLDYMERAYSLGAIDYIVKPYEPVLMRAKVSAFLSFYKRGIDLKLQSELAAREHAAREAAENANRMKDEFLATVSHELRTPLTAIFGWGEMLRTGGLGTLPESAAKAVETIVRNARAQGKLIEDLIDVSRIVAGKLRLNKSPCNLGDIIQAAIETVRPAAAAKGVQLRALLPQRRCEFACDPIRMQQVVWNLLWNGVKFSPAGSVVEAELTAAEELFQIEVRDNGIGIPSAAIPRLFDHFWQGDAGATRRYSGLGIGLTIVHRLVELHGGTIRAASEGEGRGATFTVALPAAANVPVATEMEQSGKITSEFRVVETPSPAAGIEGLHVLVVDDDDDARELMIALLTQAGARVTAVASVKAAVEIARSSAVDVLVSDLGMPDEGGLALMKRLHALEPPVRCPAIAVTGYSSAEDRERALDAGFATHVAKPFEPAALISLIARLGRVTSF